MLTAQNGEASGKVYEYMDKAIAQTDRAGQIMRRMREFVEKGETDRSFEDVNEVVEEASKLALVGARDINIEVEFNFGTDLPQVLVDKIQIQQVVVNLVRNGVEALTDSEERKLAISTTATGGDGVEVAVCDC
ncbi:MAG: PAS domain-containing sensor histidine kinase, partial [Proteobacteria bacterium]|nr:PAS domain-containing sensor histidine kinase [Pseudomonadota bacterium]